MSLPIIRKDLTFSPNLQDYVSHYRQFDWPQAEEKITGLENGAVNIAYEALDRHVAAGRGEKEAIRWLSKSGQRTVYSYKDLSDLTGKFANILRMVGVKPGDRVFGLAGRIPQLYIAALGTLKYGAVFSPLFSAFGPEPIKARMTIGDANVLVTTEALYRKKIAAWREELPSLKHILLVGVKRELDPGCHNLDLLLEEADRQLPATLTQPEDLALLHFTSGTTGKPKGAMHVHGAVVHHGHSGRMALDLQPDDVYWCTADPGWVTGTSYGIISPLVNGVTMVIDEAEFDPEHWYQVLQQEQVTVWYTAPTAIRMLMKAGNELPQKYPLDHLRFMASVGEPLNPEAVIWGQEVFGKPFHDNWWQTETGGIMIANFASEPVKPGSMGKPLPGIEAAIVTHDEQGVHLVTDINVPGELAIKVGWPSMMRGYLHEQQRYDKCFVDGWYLSGDLAQKDEDGCFWFVGRADDVIKSSGHLIGPFEVESALMEHPATAEVGVIGIPDDAAGEIVKAFVALKPGFSASDELLKELRGLARKKLGAAVAPREIAFRENLPKTRSGKIMRRLLKARELGLPEGDISTLESDEK